MAAALAFALLSRDSVTIVYDLLLMHLCLNRSNGGLTNWVVDETALRICAGKLILHINLIIIE